MSTLLPKRSWAKRPRPSQVVPEVISSAPSDSSTDSALDWKDSSKSKETTQKDDALLRSTKTLMEDAEELFSRKVTLSDPRIQAIRRQVESAMPNLYNLSQDCSPSHTSSGTSLIMRIAEDFLKKFPDAPSNMPSRPHSEAPPRTADKSSAGTRLGASAKAEVLTNVSPSQSEVPSKRLPQPAVSSAARPVPTSSMQTSHTRVSSQSPGAQSLTRPQAVSSAAHPGPVKPPPSVLPVQSASYPDTRIQYTPGTSRPPVWGSSYDATSTPVHLHDAVEHTTQHQKMVLFAVHDLLRKRSARYGRQPWYEPPIGLSPEELLSANERRNSQQFRRPSFGGQFTQYLPPAHPSHSPAGTPYPFDGKRSVAVGRSIARSASTE